MTRKKVSYDAVCFPLVFLEKRKQKKKKKKKKKILLFDKLISYAENTRNSALVNLLIFLSQSMKYVWYSPKRSKYPLFPNLLEVVNYRVLISHQPLIPVQNLSWLSVGLKSDRLAKGG